MKKILLILAVIFGIAASQSILAQEQPDEQKDVKKEMKIEKKMKHEKKDKKMDCCKDEKCCEKCLGEKCDGKCCDKCAKCKKEGRKHHEMKAKKCPKADSIMQTEKKVEIKTEEKK